MKTAAVLALAATLASAQVTINGDGSYTCAQPNAAYCGGDSLKTDIIIRCYGTSGTAGRCSDNLSGEPPVGNSIALCWQTSTTSGDAACEKNCVVYGGSGNANGTFTLPEDECKPTYTASSTSSATATSTSTSTSEGTTATSTSSSASGTVGSTTVETTDTTTVCPSSSTTIILSDSSSVSPTYSKNGTVVVTATSSGGPGLTTITSVFTPTGSATATPVGPKTSASAVSTAGAVVAQRVGGALGLVGAVAAYLL
ncbi:hypothetical protein QBC46DRAFT_62321 [Diplogelasinospora grovesii]|uniref:Uncharacterized protein n=1 Tax=Diplogelasinospora grovesii TaxID=303347 RepID=A0AAN6SAJ3_9PEZI|nr:hypothetical protein QBC46DRAFT_62321 [Diplogelasinospora grovesii]